MKSFIKLILGLVAVAMLSSCHDDSEIDTMINADGSCSRQITVFATKRFKNFDGWDTVSHPPFEKLSTGYLDFQSSERVLEAKMSKNFSSVGEMCAAWSKFEKKDYSIQSVGTLSTKFAWFYTFYTFSECFHFPEGVVTAPLKNYLKPEECRYWSTGKPNILENIVGRNAASKLMFLERQVNKWQSDIFINKFMDVFSENWQHLGDIEITKDFFNKSRADVVSAWNIDDKVVGGNNMDVFLDRFFKTDAFSKACSDSESPISKALARLDKHIKELCGRSYTCTLRMPGEIINHNTGKLDKNVLVYKLDADKLVDHYDVVVISRKANIWAFVITILVIVAAVVSYFLKIRR